MAIGYRQKALGCKQKEHFCDHSRLKANNIALFDGSKRFILEDDSLI
jgi:hypothetical protein